MALIGSPTPSLGPLPSALSQLLDSNSAQSRQGAKVSLSLLFIERKYSPTAASSFCNMINPTSLKLSQVNLEQNWALQSFNFLLYWSHLHAHASEKKKEKKLNCQNMPQRQGRTPTAFVTDNESHLTCKLPPKVEMIMFFELSRFL